MNYSENNTECCQVCTVATYHLQQRQVARPHVVEVDFHVLPPGLLAKSLAITEIVDFTHVQRVACCHVNTVIELSSKQIHTHDTKDQPEDETHQ